MSPAIIDLDRLVLSDIKELDPSCLNENIKSRLIETSVQEIDRDLPTPLSDESATSSEDNESISSLKGGAQHLESPKSVAANKELEEKANFQRLTSAIKVMISCLGEDTEREGLLKTPARYAKALLSFTEGYKTSVSEVVNGAISFEEGSEDMVVVKDIEVFSLCEHHLVPFMGKIHVGYIPNGRLLGLSKVARIVEVFARRLQIQERLTREVALALEDVLKPIGIAVVMESSHLCMVMRGVQKTSSTTTVSCMLGSFKEQADLRKEFLTLIRDK